MAETDLVDHFLAAFSSEPTPDVDRPALAELLRQLNERARATWPGFVIAASDFAAYLGAQVRGESAPVAQLATLEANDLYLTLGCLRGDLAAISAFDAILPREVQQAASRVRLDGEDLDELTQRIRVRLLVKEGDAPPKIASYAGRAPLGRWLRVSARREALSALRVQQRHTARDDELVRAASEQSPDAELAYLQHRYGTEANKAFREAFGLLSPHQRTLLKLHFVDGFTLDELAKMYSGHRSSLWRTIRKAREVVLEGAREMLRTRLNLQPSELDSLMRVVRSDLDVSISSCLRSHNR